MKKFLVSLIVGLIAVIIIPSTFAMIQLPKFSDVKNTDWFYYNLLNMQGAGVIQGYSDGTFQPGKSVNRAELVAVLDRFAEKIGVDLKNNKDIVCTLDVQPSLTIYLQDNSGTSISGASLKLISGVGGNSMLGEPFAESTSSKGTYNGIWEGNGYYTFKIEKNGFASHTETVKIEKAPCHSYHQTKTITLFKLPGIH